MFILIFFIASLGATSANPPSCPRIIDTEHIKIKYNGSSAIAQFSCVEPYYRLLELANRNVYLHCRNGKWKCVDIPWCMSNEMWNYITSKPSCPELRPPVHGTKKCSLVTSDGLINMGCKFGCMEDYWLRGSVFRWCQPDGSWNGTEASCIPKEDVDECEVDKFGCSHACVNSQESAHCLCPVGFYLDRDNKTCIDVNECEVNNFGCKQMCVNTQGSAHCSCDIYSRLMSDNKTCIISCPRITAPEHGKIKYRHSGLGAEFSCEEGYRLQGNTFLLCGYNNNWEGPLPECIRIAVRCPSVAVPLHTIVSCCKPGKEGTNWILGSENEGHGSEMSFYDLNTTCTFRCKTGYNSTVLPGAIKCQEDGTWNGTIPQCT